MEPCWNTVVQLASGNVRRESLYWRAIPDVATHPGAYQRCAYSRRAVTPDRCRSCARWGATVVSAPVGPAAQSSRHGSVLSIMWRFNRLGRVRDPEAVAVVISALRQVHGDAIARALLADGMSLAVLMDAVFSLSMRNSEAVRMIARALDSRDFVVSPDVGSLWHVKYLYDRPGSMTVVDMLVLTPEKTFMSTEISLRLPI